MVTKDRKSTKNFSSSKLNAISFFSGAMGLDIGLEDAGINVMMACEVDKASRETIVYNEPEIGLIGNILEYTTSQILEHANLNRTEQVDIIVGGPPCQAFSTAGKRKGFQDPRGNVLLKYIDVISEIRPQYVVIENVRGLLSSVLSIEPQDGIIGGSGKKNQPGSALFYIMKRLERIGYKVSFNLYNSANYGVPQIRERVIIVGTLSNSLVPYLHPTHSQDGQFGLERWSSLENAIKGLKEDSCNYIPFPEKRLKYFRMLKAGQNWKNLPEQIQPEAMGNSYFLGGGKTGFYRRLAWDKPSPTLVTHPAMPATALAHPEEDRPLSIEEYKRIQQFPDNWKICGSLIDQYKQVGNAVPTGLGRAIGKELINHHKGVKLQSIKNFHYSRYTKTSHLDFEIKFASSEIEIS